MQAESNRSNGDQWGRRLRLGCGAENREKRPRGERGAKRTHGEESIMRYEALEGLSMRRAMTGWGSLRLDGRTCFRGAVAIWLPALMLGAWAAAPQPVQAQAKSAWDGVYTEAQAERGKASYEKDCAFCHLADLSGQGFAPPLIDDAFKNRWEEGNVGELFLVTKVTMPQDKPDSLGEATYTDIVAYLLKVNKYPAGQQELKPDPAAMKAMAFKKTAGF